MRRPTILAKPPPRLAGFALIEIMVAVAVLVILIVFVAQLTNSATAIARVGDSQHFSVIAYGPDGIAIPDVAAAFRSSNPTVATVDAAGVASGRKAGAATIRVELAGQFAEATLLVN